MPDDPLVSIDDLLKHADAELQGITSAADLEPFRIKYLGAKGEIKGLMTLIGKASKEQKPLIGQK